MTAGAAAGPRAADHRAKRRAAALSIGSNSVLILVKLAAGAVTGSVAIITEAIHSSIDLLASIVAFVSVRKAAMPADEDHRYGHEKIESLAAAIEAILILVGSAVIVYESVRRLAGDAEVEALGFGIAAVGLSVVVNVLVSGHLGRVARRTESPALEGDAAHLRADAATSAAVVVGLVAVQATGAAWLDPVIALVVAVAIVVAGVRLLRQSSRVLVDEALPEDERRAIEEAVRLFGPHGVAGFHQLRTRRAGARRHVDLHVQFRAGTTLEAAHDTAHALQDEIGRRLRGADVLIHLEPEDRVRPGTEIPPDGGTGVSAG